MDYRKLAEELADIKMKMVRFHGYGAIQSTTGGERFVLGYLATHGGKAGPKEMAVAMNVSTARIAAILKQLEQKALVQRRPDPADGRYTIVEILESGTRQYKRNREEFYQSAAFLLEEMGEKDAREYVRLEHRMAEILRERENRQNGKDRTDNE